MTARKYDTGQPAITTITETTTKTTRLLLGPLSIARGQKSETMSSDYVA